MNAVVVTLTRTPTGWDIRLTDPGIAVLLVVLFMALVITLGHAAATGRR